MMAEGADPAQFQKPPYDPVPPPNPYAGYGEAPEAEAPGGIGGGLGFLDTPAGGGRAAPARTGGGAGKRGRRWRPRRRKPRPPGDARPTRLALTPRKTRASSPAP